MTNAPRKVTRPASWAHAPGDALEIKKAIEAATRRGRRMTDGAGGVSWNGSPGPTPPIIDSVTLEKRHGRRRGFPGVLKRI